MLNVNETKQYKYFSVVLKVDLEDLCYFNSTEDGCNLDNAEEMLYSELSWLNKSEIMTSSIEAINDCE